MRAPRHLLYHRGVREHFPTFHEIEGPMAVMILGGLVSSTLVSLLLIPPLAARWLRPGTRV